MSMTIERVKTVIKGYLTRCSNSLEYIKEEINDIKNEEDALYVFRQRTKETYKQIWMQKYYKDFLMRLEDVVDIEELKGEITDIEKHLLHQTPMKSSTSQIVNLFSLYEFECLQEIHRTLSTIYDSIRKNNA